MIILLLLMTVLSRHCDTQHQGLVTGTVPMATAMRNLTLLHTVKGLQVVRIDTSAAHVLYAVVLYLLQEWLASSAFPFKRTNNFVWAQHGKFHDQLVSDLGHPTRRKGLNVFAELFAYIRNQDFVNVVDLAPRQGGS